MIDMIKPPASVSTKTYWKVSQTQPFANERRYRLEMVVDKKGENLELEVAFEVDE